SQSELERLRAERNEQECVISARQSEMAALQQKRDELERSTASAQEQLAGLRAQRDQAAQNASQRVARVATLEERHRAAAAVLERIESLVSEMLERVSSLQAQIESSGAEKLQREAENEQIYREMRARLDAMGRVNMMAMEEYKETAERHAFLETQRKDLLESIENTQATIREIDTFSRQKFEEAFHKINENFQTTFKKLFGGGNVFMRLTDEENSAESGI